MIKEKVLLLINSDNESKVLGYKLLREEEPAIWAALLSYTGIDTVTDTLINEIFTNNPIINIGHVVKYKGMANCPEMVVTDIFVQTKTTTQISKYTTLVTGKYFNKSNQSFTTIKDRMECFEIIKPKKENNES